jgi:hypothetical protein
MRRNDFIKVGGRKNTLHFAALTPEQPTKLDLAVNLRTAKSLDVTIPPSVLLRADDVRIAKFAAAHMSLTGTSRTWHAD